jgi:hypothetical protein
LGVLAVLVSVMEEEILSSVGLSSLNDEALNLVSIYASQHLFHIV